MISHTFESFATQWHKFFPKGNLSNKVLFAKHLIANRPNSMNIFFANLEKHAPRRRKKIPHRSHTISQVS